MHNSPAFYFFYFSPDVYIDVLRCKLRCEEILKPSVGGYFVEKFVPTLYHYLQYAYYKRKFSVSRGLLQRFLMDTFLVNASPPPPPRRCPVNDGVRAVPCAHSYFLFEPDDEVMKQNLLYYKAYSQEWGLRSDHFTPRRVRRNISNPKINTGTDVKLLEIKIKDTFSVFLQLLHRLNA